MIDSPKKMPEPIIEPATSVVASNKRRWRCRGSCWGILYVRLSSLTARWVWARIFASVLELD
jgi:hypothetical protein